MKTFEVIFRDKDAAELHTARVEAHGWRSAITAAQDSYKAAGGKMGNVAGVEMGVVAEGAACQA